MNPRMRRGVQITCAFIFSFAPISAQNVPAYHVDSRNTYERVLVVVPWTGSGTHADPKRPMYAPSAPQMNATSRSGILAFQCVTSDDGKFALCEFVAQYGQAFAQLLADPSVKSFLKGRDKIEDAANELKKYKKDFDINQFGVRLP